MEGFNRQDSSILGFALSCLFYGAISLEEFQRWLTTLYERGEDLPVFCVDLLEMKPPLHKIFNVIGFVPKWPYSRSDELALIGIAFQRGTPPVDSPIGREAALRKLAKAPHVTEQFKDYFPFVKF